jgi:hypothetical protein
VTITRVGAGDLDELIPLMRGYEAECAIRKVGVLEWQTAPTNTRAQSLYDRGNAERSEWITYTLAVTPR